MIRIQLGHFTAQQAEDTYGDAKKGDSYVIFTVRVKNGSKKTDELVGSTTVNYGPDGKEANTAYFPDMKTELGGKLIPARAARHRACTSSLTSIGVTW